MESVILGVVVIVGEDSCIRIICSVTSKQYKPDSVPKVIIGGAPASTPSKERTASVPLSGNSYPYPSPSANPTLAFAVPLSPS